MQEKKILVTAHAGCMNTADDSLESIWAGISEGADIVEVDVRFSREDVPVLSHDPFNPALAENLVRLEEVLQVIKVFSNVLINIDMKEIKGIRSLNQLLSKTGMQERVFLTGLKPDLIPTVRQECAGIPYLVDFTPKFWRLKDPGYLNGLVEMVKSLKAIGINPNYKFAAQQLVEAFHEADMKVYVWTVDNEEQMRKMIHLGVDSITSRRVDLLVKVVREAEFH